MTWPTQWTYECNEFENVEVCFRNVIVCARSTKAGHIKMFCDSCRRYFVNTCFNNKWRVNPIPICNPLLGCRLTTLYIFLMFENNRTTYQLVTCFSLRTLKWTRCLRFENILKWNWRSKIWSLFTEMLCLIYHILRE